MSPTCSRIGIFILFSFIFWANQAVAEPAQQPPLFLEITECSGLEESSIREMVELELGAALIESSSRPEDTTVISLTCDQTILTIEVNDPVTGKTLIRRIDLENIDEAARSRLLALAVAESVAASWIELELTPEPSVPSIETSASTQVRQAVSKAVSSRITQPPPRRRSKLFLGVFGHTTISTDLLVGAGIEFFQTFRGILGWGLDLTFELGSEDIQLGEAHYLVFSTAPRLRVGTNLRWFRIEGGAGFRIGVAHLSGTSSVLEDSSVTGPWGGPMFDLMIRIRPFRRFRISLTVEGGYSIFAVTGIVRDRQEVSLRGFWLGINLSLGMAF